MPRVHPILQMAANEWESPGEDGPSLRPFTTSNIRAECDARRAEHPDWHKDLYSVDLSGRLRGAVKRGMWWFISSEPAAKVASDSTSHLCLCCALWANVYRPSSRHAWSPSPSPVHPYISIQRQGTRGASNYVGGPVTSLQSPIRTTRFQAYRYQASKQRYRRRRSNLIGDPGCSRKWSVTSNGTSWTFRGKAPGGCIWLSASFIITIRMCSYLMAGHVWSLPEGRKRWM